MVSVPRSNWELDADSQRGPTILDEDLYDWLSNLGEGASSASGVISVDNEILPSDADASAGINRAIDKAVTAAANSNVRSAILLGADQYLYSDPIGVPLPYPIGIVGRGPLISIIKLDPSLSGDVFSWTECWHKTETNSVWLAQQRAGVLLRDFSVVGDRTSSNQQNVFMFYDRNDNVLIDNVVCHFIPGRVFACGILNAQTEAYMRESCIRGLTSGWSGLLDIPVVEFHSAGTGDVTNSNQVHGLNIWGVYGPALVLRNATTTKNLGVDFWGLRLEGSTGHTVANDLFTIGDTTDAGGVGTTVYGCRINGVFSGQAGVKIKAPNVSAGARIYNVKIRGLNVAGVGNGIDIQAGRLIDLEVVDNSVSGTKLIVGPAAQGVGIITIDAKGVDAAWSKTIDSTSVKYVHSVPVNNYAATAAPVLTDDDVRYYSPGSRWRIQATGQEFVNLSNATGAAVWAEPSARSQFITGRTFTTFLGANGTAAPNAVDVLYFYPFFIQRPITVVSGMLRVVAAGAGSSVKSGVWANQVSNNHPVGAPVIGDSTGVTTQASSTNVVPVMSGLLNPGWYWHGAKFTGTLPTFTCTISTSQFMMSIMGGATLQATCLTFADAYANALPTLATNASFTESTGSVPILGLTL